MCVCDRERERESVGERFSQVIFGFFVFYSLFCLFVCVCGSVVVSETEKAHTVQL